MLYKMININKLKIYNKYKDDLDRWVRSGTKSERAIIADDDFYFIEELINCIILVNRKLAGEPLIEKTEKQIKENIENKETEEYLYKIAKEIESITNQSS